VEVVAVAGALASLAFLYGKLGRKRLPHSLVVALLILAAFVVTFRLTLDRSVRELGYEKGSRRTKPYYEKWNSYSRIAVAFPKQEPPFGWGLSDTFQPSDVLNQLRLNIDGSAETVLTRFGGNLGTLRHLKYDITNIAHYVTETGRVFVVGAGGGRDVLSALVFNQGEVVAVEMNRAIIEAVNDVFGDLTGHLDRHERCASSTMRREATWPGRTSGSISFRFR
jgi:hypothetical protein